MSAARRAGRIAVVRETLAITAYSIGDFALALRELRTYRRISGLNDQLPDDGGQRTRSGPAQSGAGTGTFRSPGIAVRSRCRSELAIAMSGARLDLGEPMPPWSSCRFRNSTPIRRTRTARRCSTRTRRCWKTSDVPRRPRQWFDRSERAMAALGTTAPTTERETIEIIEEELEPARDEQEPMPPSTVPSRGRDSTVGRSE